MSDKHIHLCSSVKTGHKYKGQEKLNWSIRRQPCPPVGHSSVGMEEKIGIIWTNNESVIGEQCRHRLLTSHLVSGVEGADSVGGGAACRFLFSNILLTNLTVQRANRLYTSESDVCKRRQILTHKDGRRTERNKIFIMAVDL